MFNAQRRLTNEYKIYQRSKKEDLDYGISFKPEQDGDRVNLFKWNVSIKFILDKNSPYYNQTYKLVINVPCDYPSQHPEMKFITKVFHPNVNAQTGEICMSLLKSSQEENENECWQVTSNIRQIVLDSYSPLNVDAANFIRDQDYLMYKSMVDYVYHQNN